MESGTQVELDGSIGEGGGQILRSALALSLVTGTPFRLANIRAGRKKPGLLRQHLTAVQAATEVGSATVTGAHLGSCELSFSPGEVRPGSYRFAVGTAGSTTLVLQTILPALATAADRSEVVLEGGTHNPFAPPFDFLALSFLPLLERMGPKVTARLERSGFYPAGGGRFRVTIDPVEALAPIELAERGEIVHRKARARVSHLATTIAERELAVVGRGLSWREDCLVSETVPDSLGPGNVLTVELGSEQVTEVFTGFGRRGTSAESVAGAVVKQAREYLASRAPVGRHLADQLLVPFALAGGGRFQTLSPTQHTLTNIEIVRAFLDIDIAVRKTDRGTWTIALGSDPEDTSHEE